MNFFVKNKVARPSCVECGLDKNCKSPRMGVSGEGRRGIVLVTGAPSRADDESGVHITGLPGRKLASLLGLYNVSMHHDCYRISAVGCFPRNKGGKPIPVTDKHIESCRPALHKQIKELNPQKILLLGSQAVKSFYGDRIKNASVHTYTGLRFWDSKYNCYVYPLYHPGYVMSNSQDRLLQAHYKRTIQQACTDTLTDPPESLQALQSKKFVPLVLYKDAVRKLNQLLSNPEPIAFDYECNTLNVFKERKKLLSVSYCTSSEVVALPLDHNHWEPKQRANLLKLWGKVIASTKIPKIVQNINFEYPWSKQALQVQPKNFIWDTQIGSHILDNRAGYTGLKLQAFMRWGIEGYNAKVEKYIHSDSTGYNKLEKLPVDTLLKYNSEDALYTYQLWLEQRQEMSTNDKYSYTLLHEGSLVLCEMHLNGICMNIEHYKNKKKEVIQQLNSLVKAVQRDKEVKRFVRKHGSFNYASTSDMKKLLFTQMGIESIKKTETNTDSVDVEVLAQIDIPLTRNIIKIRKLEKVLSTYIKAYIEITENGYIHPSYSLATARSYRSSSSNPNFQATPKRDPEGKAITRGGMIPSKNSVLVEADFSGAEISTSCCIHNDPTFIQYQTQGGGDMHTDAAAHIWDADGLVSKPIRQCTKAGFVFSQFYGSYYVSCAKQMWNEMLDLELTSGVTLREHAQRIGIHNYEEFEQRVKDFEQTFWHEWFPVYTQWKKDVVKQHEITGVIETPLHFKFKGLINRKQCCNYPIQSTSFHLLLYTMIALNKEMKSRKMKSKLIGQIHDSIISDTVSGELEEYSNIVYSIVSQLHRVHKFMSVPMGVEIEVSKTREQGGNFSEMKEIPEQNLNKIKVKLPSIKKMSNKYFKDYWS